MFPKKKKNKAEDNPEENKSAGSVADESHLHPQEETGPPARPEAVDPAHLLPQEEPKDEGPRKVKVADPSHLKPQE
jgi:hypothetical protein